ncbi:hypothetical protein CQY20_09690 [Mycolicibacterium agri]|uniref:ESX-1 secretion-associated protein n=1 Tax=Mycolicibacterium agri TaxID=36811 RepID=A0A2A7N7H7_MYCAG|nr:WXG100 family type VII secretion target [Mycolicibacterium agri]PEG39806.1 hypothetical protein CQY20_09690 [Mycolicibacterium agri]GFG52473.1 hypothetical protein MAGR_39140 [Mycolicibacterium agri]
MPEPIRVSPPELAEAAARVRDYADQLRAGHSSSAATAEGAQPGLVGESARAVDTKVARWQATTAELHRVLSSQADALAGAAEAYAGTEAHNRDVIASVDPVDL